MQKRPADGAVAENSGAAGDAKADATAYADWREAAEAVESGELSGEGFKPVGSGTEADPYAIATPEAFAWWALLHADAHARLEADLDLTTRTSDGSEEPLAWPGDSTLSGELDGAGHALAFATGGAGLFAEVAETGAVRWLVLGRTVAEAQAAADAGKPAAEVAATGTLAGSVAATNKGAVEGVVNLAPVGFSDAAPADAERSAGGIAAVNDGAIADCANLAPVSNDATAGDSSAAGIAARGAGGIATSYNAGDVRAAQNAAYIATTLDAPADADDGYAALVDDSTCYLAPGEGATYEGVSSAGADRPGALTAAELADAATRLNATREGDAAPWSRPEAADGPTDGFPAPSEPADPDAAPNAPLAVAVSADAPQTLGAADPYESWYDVGKAIYEGRLDGNGFNPQGYGTGDSPLVITTPEALAWFSYAMNTQSEYDSVKGMVVEIRANKLDMTGADYNTDPSTPFLFPSIGNEGCFWGVPSATANERFPFQGEFRGNGCIIEGLTVQNLSYTENVMPKDGRGLHAGLFGYVDGALIQGVHVGASSMVAGTVSNWDGFQPCTGGIVGKATRSGEVPTEVRDCSFSGTMKAFVVGQLGSAVKNLYFGGIVGWSDVSGSTSLKTAIKNCSFSGALDFTVEDLTNMTCAVAGIANGSCSIECCFFKPRGFVADSTRSDWTNSFFAGIVASTTVSAGNGQADIAYCYTVGLAAPADADYYAAPVAHQTAMVQGTANYCAEVSDKTYENSDSGTSVMTAATLNSASFLFDWNRRAGDTTGASPWKAAPAGVNDGYPILSSTPLFSSFASWADVGACVEAGVSLPGIGVVPIPSQVDGAYQVVAAEQLAWFAYKVNNDNANFGAAKAKIAYALDMTGERYGGTPADPLPWATIGTGTSISASGLTAPFKGALDGGKAVISHLRSGDGTAVFGGLVGPMTAGEVRNVVLDGTCSIEAKGYAAGVVAAILKSDAGGAVSVVDCTSAAAVTAYGSAGGIVGVAPATAVSLEGCRNSGTVTSSNSSAGGIAAALTANSAKGCTNTGRVTGKTAAGGITAAISAGALVEECTNAGVVSAVNQVGGIVANASGCTVENCTNAGAVSAATAGGVVARSTGATVTKSRNVGNIEGATAAGGVVGIALSSPNSTVISACSSGNGSTTVTATDTSGTTYAGGIVGTTAKAGTLVTVDNSYSASKLANKSASGVCFGIAGAFYDDSSGAFDTASVTATASYYDSEISGAGSDFVDADKGYAKTSAEMKTVKFAWELNGGQYNATWTTDDAGTNGGYPVYGTLVEPIDSWIVVGKCIYEGDGRIAVGTDFLPVGTGTQADPYVIKTPEALAVFAYAVNNDKTINGSTVKAAAAYVAIGTGVTGLDMTGAAYRIDTSRPMPWVPIGEAYGPIDAKAVSPFTGHFDGSSKPISHLLVDMAESDNNAGLFGMVAAGEVANVVLDATCSIEGKKYAGGIAGAMQTNATARVVGCASAAKVVSDSMAGGVVGSANGTALAIENCTNTGAVSAPDAVGGIAGAAGSVTNCRNEGYVLSSGTDSGALAGGIAGMLRGDAVASGCVNAGPVASEGSCAGGIAGVMSTGTVTKSGNTGNVSAYSSAGGIVGQASGGASVSSCYSRCTSVEVVHSSGSAGGIVGSSRKTATATVTNCYSASMLAAVLGSDVYGVAVPYKDASTGYNEATVTVTDSYYDATVVSATCLDADKGYARTSAEMKTWNFAYALNGNTYVGDAAGTAETVWTWGTAESSANNGYPVFGNLGKPSTWETIASHVLEGTLTGTDFIPSGAGTAGDAYVIKTPEAFAVFAYAVNNDLALNGGSVKAAAAHVRIDASSLDMTGADYGGTAAAPLPWSPIGNHYPNASGTSVTANAAASKPFKGSFDGNGCTVSNLNVQGAASLSEFPEKGSSAGLFGATEGTAVVVEGIALDGSCRVEGFVSDALSTTPGLSSAVGGIVGYADRALRISDCSFAGEVKATTSRVGIAVEAGGIVGRFDSGDAGSRVERCESTGTVTAAYTGASSSSTSSAFAGGIAGVLFSLSSSDRIVTDCFSTASVGLERLGGIVAGISANAVNFTVTNCYFAGSMSASEVPSGMAAQKHGIGLSPGGWNNYYRNAEDYTAEVASVSTPKTEAEMKTAGFVNALNAGRFGDDAVWALPSSSSVNGGFPVFGTAVDPASWADVGQAVLIAGSSLASHKPTGAGTEASPYIVKSPEGLAAFAYAANNDLAIGAAAGAVSARTAFVEIRTEGGALDLSGTAYTGVDPASIAADFSNCLPWVPIALNSEAGNAFSGTFNGKGTEIKNLHIPWRRQYSGLFGGVNNAALKGVRVASGQVNGADSMGGIVASVRGTVTVSDCLNAAKINSTAGGWTACNTGGVVGAVVDATDTLIERCSNTGDVSSVREAGGILGLINGPYANRKVTIKHCYNAGSVTASSTSSDGGFAGGIIGGKDAQALLTIDGCYNSGTVTGRSGVCAAITGKGNVPQTESNTLYLEGSGTANSNNVAKSLTSAQLKTWGAAYQLNGGAALAGVTEATAFNVAPSDSVNKGYPVLIGNGAAATDGHMDPATDWSQVGVWVLDFDVTSLMPTGAGTQASPYAIQSPEALAAFAYAVNNGLKIGSGTEPAISAQFDFDLPAGTALNLSGMKYKGLTESDIASDYKNCLRWIPIGSGEKNILFAGVFDGGECSVGNMYVDGAGGIGFFGGVGTATVKNVGVASGAVYGSANWVGGVIGLVGAANATVERCWNNASVTCNQFNVGGVVGCTNNAGGTKIKKCWNLGTVSQTGSNKNGVGGIVGKPHTGTQYIEDCYNLGEIKTTGSMAGGIMGATNATVKMSNCFNAGVVSGGSSGGLSGTAGPTATNSYYATDVGAADAVKVGSPLTSVQLKTWGAAYQLNGGAGIAAADGVEAGSVLNAKTWRAVEGGYPTIASETQAAAGEHLRAAADWGEVGAWVENLNPTVDGTSGGTKYKPTAPADASGSYTIGSEEALAWFAYKVNSDSGFTNHNVNLTKDLNLAGSKYSGKTVSSATDALAWTPIGGGTNTKNYVGTFTGNDHTVSSLYVDIPSSDNGAGLIGRTGNATITGFGVASGLVTAMGHTGSIVGFTGGILSMSECWNAGTVTRTGSGDRQHVGGLVGGNEVGGGSSIAVKLQRCYNMGTVTTGELGGDTGAGGLVGWAPGSSLSVVQDCYNMGTVNTKAGYYAGGIIGGGSTGGSARPTVSDCYNMGAVSSDLNQSYGPISSWRTIIVNCYDGSGAAAKPYDNTGAAIALTTSQMKTAAFANKLNATAAPASGRYDGNAVWFVDAAVPANQGYPTFAKNVSDWNAVAATVKPLAAPASGGSYRIADADDLAWFASQVNASAVPSGGAAISVITTQNASLTGGADLLGNGHSLASGPGVAFENCLKWTPIGTAEAPYTGTFDGGGKAVSNLSVSAASNAGLFGTLGTSTVKNVAVASGSVAASAADSRAGGVAGTVAAGSAVAIEGCSNAASVSSGRAGGILGATDVAGVATTVSFADCSNSGAVSGQRAGGIASTANGAGMTLTAVRCSNAGEVTGEYRASGIASAMQNNSKATVADCYNRGVVNTTDSTYYGSAAGIVACDSSAVTVSNCYSAGTVSPGATGAPIVSGASIPSGSIVNCYYQQGTASDGRAAGAISKTAAQLKTWKTAYLLNQNKYVGCEGSGAPAATVWSTDAQMNGASLKNDGYPVFGDLAIEQLTVELDPGAISVAAGSSKKTSGTLKGAGGAAHALSGAVTLLEAPEVPAGVTLSDASAVDAAFSTWGTDSANAKVALVAGSVSIQRATAAGTSLGSGLAAIDLHAAAAYNASAVRTVTFAVMDEEAGYKVTATLKPVTSKTLNVTVPVESGASFELAPDGKLHENEMAKTTSVLKSNNAVPIAGNVSSVAPLAKDATVSYPGGSTKKVSAVLSPVKGKLTASADSITGANKVRLLAGASTGSGATAGLTPLASTLYYDPSKNTVPLAFSVPGGGQAAWKWGMDYTGTYLEPDGVFGFSMGYAFGLPTADVASAQLKEKA